MYYNDNNSINFNSSIWGTDNNFFPRASEKENKETEDLLADISYLGKSSSEDIKTNESRSENTTNQGTGPTENQPQEMSGTTVNQGQGFDMMGGGNFGVYPANQSLPFNMTATGNQGFSTSTNPLYGTYFMAQNNPSMGFFSEGISPTNPSLQSSMGASLNPPAQSFIGTPMQPSAQSFMGAPMHPSMYGWTHYCIPHMPATPIATYVTPPSQEFMGSQFSGVAAPQYPFVTFPDISSTGGYNLSGTMGASGFTGTMWPQGTSMNTNTMNTQGAAIDSGAMSYVPWDQSMNMGMSGAYGFGAPMNVPGMVNPWFNPGAFPMGVNHMAIFPYTPYTSGLGPLIVQRDDLDDMDDMDEQEDNTQDSMDRGSKRKRDKRRRHKKHCFYYNAFSNYPYYSPLNSPMQHHSPEGWGLIWIHPSLLNFDMN